MSSIVLISVMIDMDFQQRTTRGITAWQNRTKKKTSNSHQTTQTNHPRPAVAGEDVTRNILNLVPFLPGLWRQFLFSLFPFLHPSSITFYFLFLVNRQVTPPEQNSTGSITQHLTAVAPARSIDDDAHQAARDDAGHGQSDEPAHVDPAHKAPVDGPPRARAKTDTDGSASDALCSGNRELCSKLHG